MFEIDPLFVLAPIAGLVLVIGLRLVFGYVANTPESIANLADKKKSSDYPTGGEGF